MAVSVFVSFPPFWANAWKCELQLKLFNYRGVKLLHYGEVVSLQRINCFLAAAVCSCITKRGCHPQRTGGWWMQGGNVNLSIKGLRRLVGQCGVISGFCSTVWSRGDGGSPVLPPGSVQLFPTRVWFRSGCPRHSFSWCWYHAERALGWVWSGRAKYCSAQAIYGLSHFVLLQSIALGLIKHSLMQTRSWCRQGVGTSHLHVGITDWTFSGSWGKQWKPPSQECEGSREQVSGWPREAAGFSAWSVHIISG